MSVLSEEPVNHQGFTYCRLNAMSVCVCLQYDPENSGFISTERFRELLETHGSELDPHKLEVLLALADGNADGKICYQDFVNLVRCFTFLYGCRY